MLSECKIMADDNNRCDSIAAGVKTTFLPELSMVWIDPSIGLCWVEIFQYLVGWLGSTIAKVLKNLKRLC